MTEKPTSVIQGVKACGVNETEELVEVLVIQKPHHQQTVHNFDQWPAHKPHTFVHEVFLWLTS